MGQALDRDKAKKIVEEELQEIFEHYEIDVQDIDIDIDEYKVNVTFGLHTAGEDYIGLLID